MTGEAGDDEEVTMAITDVAPVPLSPAGPAAGADDGEATLAPGTKVEVRSKLEARRWSRGFEVIAEDPDGYRLRRLSDGEEMPVPFPADDVRKERKRGGWWY